MTEEATSEVVENTIIRWTPGDNDAPIGHDDREGQIRQIHRKMFEVKCDLPAIAKGGTLTLGGKDVPFTKIDDIRKALYPIFAKHGIMAYPVYQSGTDEIQVAQEPLTLAVWTDRLDAEGNKTGERLLAPSREVRDGTIPNTRYWATVVYSIQFVYVGDNSGVVVTTKGLAYDTNSDKAVGKATTAAIKRAFMETFDIIDQKEADENDTDDDEKNRPTTTDKREGADRGAQARTAAAEAPVTGTSRRSGPQRNNTTTATPAAARARSEAEEAAEATGADAETGEVPEEAPAPDAPPAVSKLDAAKARVRAANTKLGLDTATVDAIVLELTDGKEKERAGEKGWLTKVTVVTKLAVELENRLKSEHPGGVAEFAGGEK